MRMIIYKITFDDDKCFYTDNRNDLVVAINERNKHDDTFKKFKHSTIDGILYNNYKKHRGGVKSVEKFDAQTYYEEYINTYINNIIEKRAKSNKTYSDGAIKRFKYHFITLLNSIEFDARNNGDTDEMVKEKIETIGMIKV